MAELPINLKIRNSLHPQKLESVECCSLLRSIPGKREVYDALWNNQPVIVKIFLKKIFAFRHLKREWQGLKILQKRQLNSPKPLFFGETADGSWAIVTEKIVNSSTALDIFNSAENNQDKLKLLILVCRELANQNGKGVLQKDLHLGNFILAGDEVYALDPARMEFFHRPLCKSKSTSQLALLSCFLPDDYVRSFERLCREYFDARQWQFDETQKVLVLKSRDRHRKKQIKKGLKKYIRTSKRTLSVKSGQFFAIFDRGFIEHIRPIDFIEQIDSLMDAGRILKKGRTSYLSRLMWNGKDVVVKRYNHKGLIHSLRHTIKGSRARRNWLFSHRLAMLEIPTPRPLAFIEQRKGQIIWQSYIVTEYIEGQKLYDFLKNSRPEQQEQLQINGKLKNLMSKLAKYRITHGDLKHTNILITEDKVVLTDLDSMRYHKVGWFYKACRARDMNYINQFIGSSEDLNLSSEK